MGPMRASSRNSARGAPSALLSDLADSLFRVGSILQCIQAPRIRHISDASQSRLLLGQAPSGAGVAFRFTTGHAVPAQGDRFAKEMFPFKNTTGQMVHISKITTSCSCTAARASSKLIKPGGRGEIVATVRLKGLPPHFVRYITVYELIGSGPLPVHQKLKLLVTITPR